MFHAGRGDLFRQRQHGVVLLDHIHAGGTVERRQDETLHLGGVEAVDRERLGRGRRRRGAQKNDRTGQKLFHQHASLKVVGGIWSYFKAETRQKPPPFARSSRDLRNN